ncbi:GntR family transcriptional regulator [Streptomyces sp. CAU 1734]|uniref:GntR family transcriptional regulator n=1 Tax=Streptomyces sp. CAU 1734 TaxID=3140360 RepID=UPI003261BED2
MEHARPRAAARPPQPLPQESQVSPAGRVRPRLPEQSRGDHPRAEHTRAEPPSGRGAGGPRESTIPYAGGARPGGPRGESAAPRADGAHPESPRGGGRPDVPNPPRPGAPHRAGPRTVQRHSVRGQILQALRTALIDGDLIPGEVYSAPALGDRFGVSATPVREAMQQLAAEGAVEVVPNRGFRVTVRTPRELAELAELRALIEAPVVLRLARTVPAGRWRELRPSAEATMAAAAAGDRVLYAEADRAFHRALLALSGNDQLVTVADDLHRRAQWPLTASPAVHRADLMADAAEHLALLDALAADDSAMVRRLVRAHFGSPDG